MFLCEGCKTEMVCAKNGVIAKWGEGHCYSSDRFRCPKCGECILITAQQGFYSKEEFPGVEYVQMRDDEK